MTLHTADHSRRGVCRFVAWLCGLALMLMGNDCRAVHFGEVLEPGQFRPVGRVLLVGQDGKTVSHGTGTLIAPDIVLTVGHVVVDALTPQHIRFEIAGMPRSPISAVAYRVHPEYYSGGVPRVLNATGNDVALVRLATPVPGITEFYRLAESAPAVGTITSVIGYGQTERKETTISLDDVKRRKGELKCLALDHGYLLFGAGGSRFQRTDHGDSGGPLLRPIEGGHEIVAVVQGRSKLSNVRDLVSDEYGYYVSIAAHRAWLVRTMAQLNAVDVNVDTLFYAIRTEQNSALPALNLNQLRVLAKLQTPDQRLFELIGPRGSSDPLPKGFVELVLNQKAPTPVRLIKFTQSK